jgi:cytochrome P450
MLGEQLAFLEMTLTLAMFVTRFSYECEDKRSEIELAPWVTLRPKNAIRVRCETR